MNIRDPRTQKIMLGVILVAGLYYLYFGMTTLPFAYRAKAEKIDVLKEEYAKLSSEVTQARRLAADLPRVEALHQRTQKRWERANELLPPRTDMAGLLRQVTLVGLSSGVDFVNFEPTPPVNHPYYAENPVEVSVIGGYHQVGAFFSEIAALGRLVNVGSLKLTTLKGGDEDETVTATFVASAYSVTGSHVRATQASVNGTGSGNRSAKAGRPARPVNRYTKPEESEE